VAAARVEVLEHHGLVLLEQPIRAAAVALALTTVQFGKRVALVVPA
jgi:hypothetical protein